MTFNSFGMQIQPIPELDEQELDILQQARRMAEEAQEHVKGWPGRPENAARCVQGEAVFWLPHYRALIPGHIYSDLGREEYSRISRMCEYHFDKATDPDWEVRPWEQQNSDSGASEPQQTSSGEESSTGSA